MAIFIDVLLVAIFLLTLIRHTRLGLACSILSACRFFASLILAALLYYPVASLLHGAGAPEALSGILGFIAVFAAMMILSKLLIKLLNKIKIPVVTRVDRFLGFLLGLLLGFIFMSLVSTSIYTLLELLSVSAEGQAMTAYYDSYVFKFVYELEMFEFIRNLL